MENYLNIVLGLGGFATLGSFLIGLFKKLGLIKDGQSAKWHTGVQVILFVLVAVVDIFGFNVDILQWDTIADTVASLGAVLLSILGMLGVGGFTYNKVKGVPVIGFSYSE